MPGISSDDELVKLSRKLQPSNVIMTVIKANVEILYFISSLNSKCSLEERSLKIINGREILEVKRKV